MINTQKDIPYNPNVVLTVFDEFYNFFVLQHKNRESENYFPIHDFL